MKKVKIKKIISFLHEISHFNRYLILSISFLFLFFFYISIPTFYNFESLQKQLATKIQEKYKFNVSLSDKISYRILPSPFFEITDNNLYLEEKDKSTEFGKIKKIKIFISARSLYKQEKIKIKKILFQDSVFDLNEDSWKFFENYFRTQISEKKIIIKKSKIFIKKNLDYGALAIFTINNLETFYDYKKNQNVLNAVGTMFNTPFNIKWKNDLDIFGNLDFIVKFNEINVAIKHNLKKKILKNNFQYEGNQTLNFIGSEIKANYKLINKLLSFESEDSKINNKPISLHGTINFKPFFFDIHVDMKNADLFKLFKPKFLINDLINSNIYLHNNFNGKLSININKLTRNKIFDFAKFNINFKNGKLIFDKTELSSKKFGTMQLYESQLIELDKKNVLKTKAIINIDDQKNFYQRFQISKNLRKPLDKIYLEIEKDLNSESLKIFKFNVSSQGKNYSDENIEIYLKNINYDLNINNIYDLNKFFKEIFKEIS
tara:strand:- start:632 stop:2098 length:1467 start_codon:yes stop_codon:yes gene_type:complete